MNLNTIPTTKPLLTKSSFSKFAKLSVHSLLLRRFTLSEIYPRHVLERLCDVSCVRLLLERAINWEIWVLWRNLVWLIWLKRKLRRVLDDDDGRDWDCRKRLEIVSELVSAGIFKQKGTTTTRFCCKNEIVYEIFSKYICFIIANRVKMLFLQIPRVVTSQRMREQ